MKKLALIITLLLSAHVRAQVITTVAGNGTYGYTGDGGQATAAQLADMYLTYPVFDAAGNMYICQVNENTIRKIDPSGIITTIAGTPNVIGYFGDGGPASAAQLYHPMALAADNAGNLYVGDQNGQVIRKIDAAGIITTISGPYNPSPTPMFGDGGPISGARFHTVGSMRFDAAGNMYISDLGDNVVRKVDASGIITTIAGNGTAGFSGDGGPATSAQLNYPGKVYIDANGTVYIPDASNNRIRMVSPSGVITTFAGSGAGVNGGDGGQALSAGLDLPGSMEKDPAGIYYLFSGARWIRRIDPSGVITTFAGNGTIGFSGDGGPPLQASLRQDFNYLSMDASGNIYFVNYGSGNVIRKIAFCKLATIDLHPVDATTCVGGNASFSLQATGATAYRWQVDAGSGWTDIIDNAIYSGSATDRLSITTAMATQDNYKYRCSVTNACGATFSATALLKFSKPLTPAVSITPAPATLCGNASFTFTAVPVNGGSTPAYQWSLNGTPVGSNSVAYTKIGWTDGDKVQCTLTTSEGCVTSPTATSPASILKVTTPVTPTVSIINSLNAICAGTAVSFTATPVNGGPTPTYAWYKNNVAVNVTTPTYTDVSLNDNDKVYCVIQSSLSCLTAPDATSNTITINVTPVINVSISVAPNQLVICPGKDVTYSVSPGNAGANPSFSWTKNGLPVGDATALYVNNDPANGDLIVCTMKPDQKCPQKTPITATAPPVTVRPKPDVTLDQTPYLCPGTTRTLDAGTFVTYAWNTGDATRTITVSDTGLYTVTVTDANGCTGSFTTHISTRLANLTGFMPADTTICIKTSLALKAEAGYSSYTWSTGATTPSITVTNPGDYWLEVKEGSSGCMGRDTVTVTGKDCVLGFFMPNAFTPNGDGLNDIIHPILRGDIQAYRFRIFNRFGQIVFDSADPQKGWDGIFKGSPQSTQTFTWTCRFQFNGSIMEDRKGTLVLIR